MENNQCKEGEKKWETVNVKRGCAIENNQSEEGSAIKTVSVKRGCKHTQAGAF